MASISSLSSSSTSSTSSLFGNSNVISGLASGMDTESMIENAVSGIKEKISGLNKDRTMLEWEQSAYQSIIDKLANFADKYAPYYTYSSSSSSNLLSEAFFDNATKVSSTGTYKDLVSATGKSNSEIKILAATMATRATLKGAQIGASASTTLKAQLGDTVTWLQKKDADGNLVNSSGKIVDANGYLADKDGNLMDANGNYIVDAASGQKVNSANLDQSKTYKMVDSDGKDVEGKDNLKWDGSGKFTRTTTDDSGKENTETVVEKSSIVEYTTLKFTLTGSDQSETTIDVDITSGMTMSQIASTISSKTGLEASFSEATGAFLIKSKDTGEGTFSVSGDAASALFGATSVTAGTKSKVVMDVNGYSVTKELNSNQIEVDGMTINIKGAFGDVNQVSEADAVTFSSSVNSDKIVDTIKSMVDDFNEMANEIRTAYATQPLKDSDNKRYEPLTEEEAADMSESAIAKYETKAKTGILFADSNLSALYDELRSAANALGGAGIGLTAEYKDGKTTLVLDEEKLRSTLEADPDKVKDAFTKTQDANDKYNAKGWGGMTSLKETLHKYASTSGALSSQGILVQLAGTEKSTMATAQNTYKSKLADIDELIARWQEKLSDKVDYYQKQYTNLEKLISQMNSQSSSLSGMMGY